MTHTGVSGIDGYFSFLTPVVTVEITQGFWLLPLICETRVEQPAPGSGLACFKPVPALAEKVSKLKLSICLSLLNR